MIRDRLSDLEAEVRPVRGSEQAETRLTMGVSADADASMNERRKTKSAVRRDEHGRILMSPIHVERHMQALRVFGQYDPETEFTGDYACFVHVLCTDAWFQSQGFVMQPNLDITFGGEVDEDACLAFFGEQASGDEDAVYVPEVDADGDETSDGDYIPLIGMDFRDWWTDDRHTPRVGDIASKITSLLEAHGVNSL